MLYWRNSDINFDKAFGVHPHAMLIRSQRAELLATNIANADTPGYKAKDIDFAAALKAAKSNQQGGVRPSARAMYDMDMTGPVYYNGKMHVMDFRANGSPYYRPAKRSQPKCSTRS